MNSDAVCRKYEVIYLFSPYYYYYHYYHYYYHFIIIILLLLSYYYHFIIALFKHLNEGKCNLVFVNAKNIKIFIFLISCML